MGPAGLTVPIQGDEGNPGDPGLPGSQGRTGDRGPDGQVGFSGPRGHRGMLDKCNIIRNQIQRQPKSKKVNMYAGSCIRLLEAEIWRKTVDI